MEVRSRELVFNDEYDAELLLENGVSLKFTLTQNFETLLSDLDAALLSEEISLQDIVSRDSDLEYIDFRFDNRVFFK